MSRILTVSVETFPIAGRFTIARGSRTEATVVVASVSQGIVIGRGECVPYARYGETSESVSKAIAKVKGLVEGGLSREGLQQELPAGAARNALDCALWDLDAKLSGVPAHISAGIDRLRPVTTAYTISLDTPEAMEAAVRKASARPILKIKLGAPEGDHARIAAVRRAAPDAVLIADANEGWVASNLASHLEACAEAGFSLVEQPLPVGRDDDLAGIPHPVPICADESVHDCRDIARVAGLYEAVNIKLDKAGGLTEALAMAEAAQARGLAVLVGCMVSTSLAMAPAMLLTPRARFVDLDGPLLLARDRDAALHYDGSIVHPPERALWG